MQRYKVVRLLQTIVALWAVSIIVFALARITGNPLDTLLSFEATLEDRERVAAALGLDRPLYTQYFIFVGNVLRGEFGESFKWRLPASELVFGRFPASLALAGLAITIATLVAVPLGVITAVKREFCTGLRRESVGVSRTGGAPLLAGPGAHLGVWR